jgi:FLVCR family MFS transporter 7
MSDDEQPLLYNAVTNSLQICHNGRPSEHRSYHWRWFMLAVVAVLNLSSGMLWMSFSSIADSTGTFYDIDQMKVNWLSIVFMITTIVLGLPAIWILDNIGLRMTLLTAAWLNVLGAVGRILSTVAPFNSHKYTVLLLSQIIAGCAQPFIIFSPTKLASQWFNEHQRTFANMIGSTANPIGIMLGSILSSVIVPSVQQSSHIDLMLQIFAIPAYLGVLMTTFGVCSSVPPTPPSESAAEECETFLVGMKTLLCIKSYWLLALCFGGGIGLLSTLVTILDQLLCTHGYPDGFVGLCSGLLFGIGLIGATIMSIFVDKTRKFEETSKIGFGVCACALISFIIITRYSHMDVVLALLCAVSGFFGLALYPICLELSVECSFPVAEGTSAGFLVLSGQIQAALYTILMTLNVDANTRQSQMCDGGEIISIYAIVGFITVTGVLAIVFVQLFHCDYRRQCIEEQRRAESIVSTHSVSDTRQVV